MTISPRRFATLALIAVFVAGMIYFLLRPEPVPVDLHTIAKGPLVVTIDEEGVSEIRDIYKVSSPIAGRVLRSPLHVGDPVEAGKTIVATIQPVAPSLLDERQRQTIEANVKAAESAVELAQANLARAKTDLEFKEKELWRATRLHRHQTVSDRFRDQAQLERNIAEAARNTAMAELGVRQRELESMRAQLIEPGQTKDSARKGCCVESLAPISGRVIRINTESESVIAAGTPLAEVGDPRDIEIVVDLLSSDAVKITEGAPARVVSWGGQPELQAIVRRIEPTGFTKVSALGIEEQRVKVRLDLTDPYEVWSRLGHDYRVFVRIVVWEAKEVLSVPLSALFRSGDRWTVFVADGSVAREKNVRIGHRNDSAAEIIDGLTERQTVILHPSDRVKDGTGIVDRASLR